MDRAELVTLAERLLAHHRSGTTDSAPDTMAMPVESYLDPRRWEREIDRIFRRVPLALALSIELPGPGTYKALEAAGVPVLIARGGDGVCRAFINTCRHRGAPVCAVGSGAARRFSCPYHAWVYDDRGALVGMFGAETFGPIDRSVMGLTSLPAEERAGFVWVSLTPGPPLDLDRWLAGFDCQLEALGLAEWQVYEQRELEGPGWKVTWDGYLEGYHQQALHPETVGKDTIANLMAVDTFGPHQRFVFGRKNLAGLSEARAADPGWDPTAFIRLIHSVFPNVSISGVLHDHCLVSQVFPGPTFDRTRTVQTILVRDLPETDAAREAARNFSAMVLRAVRDEDYAIGFEIQRTLGSGGNTHLTFGRNEPTLQHFHRWVERLLHE